jgi:hypothetical protein
MRCIAEETRMMDPPPVISRNSFCTRKTGPRAMRLNALSKCSGVMASIVACSVNPAFETTMSTTPFSAFTAAVTRSRSARFAASAWIAVTLRPISLAAPSLLRCLSSIGELASTDGVEPPQSGFGGPMPNSLGVDIMVVRQGVEPTSLT